MKSNINIGILTQPNNKGGEYLGTRRYREEIAAAGHTPVVIDYSKAAIEVSDTGTTLYEYDDADEAQPLKPVRNIDVVIANTDGNLDAGMVALHALINNGIPSTHQPETIATANNKMLSHLLFQRHGIPTFHSVMPLTRAPEQIDSLFRLVEPDEDARVVIKKNEGTRGEGVMRLDSRVSAESVLESKDLENEAHIIQEFLAPVGGKKPSDKRLVMVEYELVAAMKRTGNKFKTGISTNGAGEIYEPTPREIEMAQMAARAIDAPYAGVDIMDSARGPLVNEINVFPGLVIEKVTGINVAAKLVNFAIRKYYETNSRAIEEDFLAV